MQAFSLRRFSALRLIDLLWLAGLATYIVAGLALAPFHGDEAFHLYMSRDFATMFLEWQPSLVAAQPPYEIATPNQQRLIVSSLTVYGQGLAWWLAGYAPDDLPPRLWDWPQSYEANSEAGHRPSQGLLLAARVPSTVMLAVSVVVLFAVGEQLGNRTVAYLATLVYALNPIILLNGRRAMQEGALLCFGLLAVWCAFAISRRLGAGERVGWWRWAGLATASGLAVAGKHSGVVFVVAAFGWVAAATLVNATGRLGPALARLALAGMAAVGLFVVLTPPVWGSPVERLADIVSVRRAEMAQQVLVHPDAPTTLGQRLMSIVTWPFSLPPLYYETDFWANAEAIRAEIARYEASGLNGAYVGPAGGAILMLAAGAGLAVVARGRSVPLTRGDRMGVLIWVLVTVGSLLANPLPWLRYAIPWIPLVSLLAAVGMVWVVGICLRVRTEQDV